MPKPDWLVEKETGYVAFELDHCSECIYYGKPIKVTKHKNKEWTEVFECDVHPGCFNTKYSICCDDFVHA